MLLTSPETCRKKRTFLTNKAAKNAVKRRNMAERYKWTEKYKCNVCGYWHLTTMKDRDKKMQKPVDNSQ